MHYVVQASTDSIILRYKINGKYAIKIQLIKMGNENTLLYLGRYPKLFPDVITVGHRPHILLCIVKAYINDEN